MRQKYNLPDDVIDYINNSFATKDGLIVKEFLIEKTSANLNVGKEQFARALLFLIDKDITNIKNFRVINDPRDLIMLANLKSNNKYNSFNDSLD